MTKIIVYHDGYGCETGCCGHTVEVTEGEVEGDDGSRHFQFDHPYYIKEREGEEGLKQWARELIIDEFGPEHANDLDWENSFVTDEC